MSNQETATEAVSASANSDDSEETRQVVLDLIVEKGPISVGSLAKILNLTTAAVRRHISALRAEEMIEIYKPSGVTKRGRGRPANSYVASSKGHASLVNHYSNLAAKALAYMEQLAGSDAIDSFVSAHSKEIEQRYAKILTDAGNAPRQRANALAQALNRDGYAATVREVAGTGGYAIQLCQGHCPVADIARDYPQFCDAETKAFSKLLDVHVQRLATQAAGEHVCTTSIPIGVPDTRINRQVNIEGGK